MQVQRHLVRPALAGAVLLALVLGLLPIAAATTRAPAQVDPLSKVAPWVLEHTAGDASTTFIVVLTRQADTSGAAALATKNEKAAYVYEQLTRAANESQGPIKTLLDARQVPYRVYWIVNMITVERGDRALVLELAARPDVARIHGNPTWKMDLPEPEAVTPEVIEWGIQNTNAPQVWAQGVDGTGIVIAGGDTGIRWTHQSLRPKYRGWNGSTADHNYNWWDAIHSGGGTCGPNSQEPCDDTFHGTHTVGTIVGGDGSGPDTNDIGMAYGAKWIGCRNMDVGNGTPTTYIECNQFFLAPTDLNGQNPNPALAPHAINNSWGCPPSEGCVDETPTLRQSIENLVAAGVVFVASAGNSGSACSTVSNPPAIYAASFSIAAHSSANVLAGFSSRGPVTFDSSNRRKPDISGPGVSVRSATNSGDTSYSTASGTSMAGPHVVGAIALLLDHDPSLIGQVQQIINRLEQTSNPALTLTSGAPETCGGIHYTTIPNNHFGYGRVDILAAVNQGQGTATPTPPPATPSPTATACGAPAHWMAGEPFPVTMVRGVGVWFPPNGRFYDMGGRQSDAAGSGLLNPYEYDPTTDTWITKTATFEGQQVGNAAAAALNGPSGWRIYMVGGSAGGGTGSTDVVREYDPISDTITLLATDPWPGALGNTTLPGGFAVYNNKLYILGGFQIVPGGMVDAIWEFDPMAAAGSRWTEKTAVLPVPLGYVPATTIGNYIYTAGGSEWDGTTLADSDYSYRYDPVADTITTITSIPRLTAETRALNVDGEMWVMGGGRDAPNPSNEVNIYDPATNSWSLGMPFTTARRNFAVDVDPATGSIFLVGGYAPTASTNSMEIYMPAVPCETPTPTPTNTAEPTATSTPPAEWRLYLPLVVYNWP